MNELLTTAEMYEADRATIARGTPGLVLMERAGAACAREIMLRWPRAGRVAVLCGPGNNGGDGFVIARLLQEAGYEVTVALLGERWRLAGDAAEMAARWQGDIRHADHDALADADLVVDALFGAGLARNIDGEAAALIEHINTWPAPVLSVDVPSGVDGTTGQVRGCAVEADLTVTFFRKKRGHLLMPGRAHCGDVIVADIGISSDAARDAAVFENAPSLWQAVLPQPRTDGHKYDRGHAVVLTGGATTTGAGRLAARAALRAGAGLVTVASPGSALAVNAAHLTAIMLQRCDDAVALSAILEDERRNAVVLGPGLGVGESTQTLVLAALDSAAACVLDADALTSFEREPARLFEAIRSRAGATVLTPHAGEFARLFAQVVRDDKLEAARSAAAKSGAVVVLKGADTMVAVPQGRVAINATGSPWLATAGSGDVLAGMIGGFLAGRASAFEAAAAAVYLHGEAGASLGPGLIAEDLPEALPAVLRQYCRAD